MFFVLFSRERAGPPSFVIFHLGMAPQSYEEMMRVTENLSEKYVIGRGGSSTVYKCSLKNGHPIAIKKLYNHFSQNVHEFETELKTLGNIKHRNLVSLRGYSMSSIGNFLFYDFMENGSLYDLLHGTTTPHKQSRSLQVSPLSIHKYLCKCSFFGPWFNPGDILTRISWKLQV